MSQIISHSYKGTTWKKHKYIRKTGSRYYYPKNSASSKLDPSGRGTVKSLADVDSDRLRDLQRQNFEKIVSDMRADKISEAEKKEAFSKPITSITQFLYEIDAAMRDFLNTPIKDLFR